MSGSTASGWPYIEDNDDARDYPEVSRALADKLEIDAGGGGGGVTDHGALTGLSDPDHPIAAVIGLQAALDGKSATSHQHTLDSLSDVATSGAISGQALVFGGSSWAPETVSGGGGGATTLDGLSDVNTSGAAAGHVLTYQTSGYTWIGLPTTVTAHGHYSTFVAEDVWNGPSGGGAWNTGPDGSPWTIADFGTPRNVSRITAKSDSGVLTWTLEGSPNGVTWTTIKTNINAATGAGNTYDFSVVTYRYFRMSATGTWSDPNSFDLYTNDAQWVPAPSSGTGVTDHGALTGLGDNDHPQYLMPAEVLAGANVTVDTTTTPGSVIVAATGGGGGATTLDDLSDVTTSGVISGQSLVYTGSVWGPGTISGGGGGATTLDSLTDVVAPSPAGGDALIWSVGTAAWVPGAVAGGSGAASDSDQMILAGQVFG
jgi:hypothetical protein